MSKVLYWVNIRFHLINGDFRFLLGTDLWGSVAVLPNTNQGILMRKILLSSWATRFKVPASAKQTWEGD